MSTQQARAILVMLESVEHQIAAIKQLVSLADSEPAGKSRVHKMPQASAETEYLSPSEEQALEQALGMDDGQLNAMVARIAEAAMGEQTDDVSGGL